MCHLTVSFSSFRYTRSRWTCDAVELFIRHGCDIRAVDNEGNTPLHRTAESDREDIATILLDRGAEMEALDWQASTPLHVAGACNSVRVSALLVERDGNTRALDGEGRTPQDIAYKSGNYKIVDLMEDHALQSNGWLCDWVLHFPAFECFRSWVNSFQIEIRILQGFVLDSWLILMTR